jgi:hypothetical protein
MKIVDTTIQSFLNDVTSLEQLLTNVKTVFARFGIDFALTHNVDNLNGKVWTRANELLESCKTTLKQLEKILVKLGKRRNGLLAKQLKMEFKSSDLQFRHRQLQTQRATLQILLKSTSL